MPICVICGKEYSLSEGTLADEGFICDKDERRVVNLVVEIAGEILLNKKTIEEAMAKYKGKIQGIGLSEEDIRARVIRYALKFIR